MKKDCFYAGNDLKNDSVHPTHKESVTIALPEYDLRRAATARDPLAVVEGYAQK